jgi:hypothetical protein
MKMQIVTVLSILAMGFLAASGKPQLQTNRRDIGQSLLRFVELPKTHSCFSGDSCDFQDGSKGICRIDADCQFVIDLIKNKKRNEIVNCGFQGRNQIVCCKNPKQSDEFAKDFLCQGKSKKRPWVWCELPEAAWNWNGFFEDFDSAITLWTAWRQKLENSRTLLHLDTKQKRKTTILGEVDSKNLMQTFLRQLLEKIFYRCGGSLIGDGRFVLTAAHCVNTKIRPIVVRLGKVFSYFRM